MMTWKTTSKQIILGWILALALLAVALIPPVRQTEAAMQVDLHGVFELAVTNTKNYNNPFDYTEIELQASFQAPSGRQIDFFGFYDGDGQGGQDGSIWKLRFMPDEPGDWSYTYTWTDGTAGGSGSFQAVDTGLPGPLRVDPDHPWFFETARGEPFDWRGYDVRYLPLDQNHVAWRGPAAANHIAVLQNSALPRGYNFILISTPSAASHDRADGDFGSWWTNGQTDQFDTRVWRNFEQIAAFALDQHIYLIPFDGMVAQPNADHLTRKLLRYAAARLGPYASFLGYSPTWEYYDVFTEGQVDDFMTFLENSLPSGIGPLHTAHDQARSAFQNWQEFHMRQGANNAVTTEFENANDRSLDVEGSLQPFDKPIIGSEDIWESPGYWGDRLHYAHNALEVRRTAWAEMLAGVLPLYSEWNWFLAEDDPTRLGSGEGEIHVRRMFDFFYSRTQYRRYRQLNDLVSGGVLASGIPGEEYLAYDPDGGTIDLALDGVQGTFTILWFEPPTGESIGGGTVEAGDTRSLSSPFSGESAVLVRRESPAPTNTATPAPTGTPTPQPTDPPAAEPTDTPEPTQSPQPNGFPTEGVMRINFQPADDPVPDGFLVDDGSPFGDRGSGLFYGWNGDNRSNARRRDAANSPDPMCDTLNHMQENGDFAWELALPIGIYQIRVVAGDPLFIDSRFRIQAENVMLVNGVPDDTRRWLAGSAIVPLRDGRLTITSVDGAVNNKINSIEITPWDGAGYYQYLPQVRK